MVCLNCAEGTCQEPAGHAAGAVDVLVVGDVDASRVAVALRDGGIPVRIVNVRDIRGKGTSEWVASEESQEDS